jgi:hypothetical protein
MLCFLKFSSIEDIDSELKVHLVSELLFPAVNVSAGLNLVFALGAEGAFLLPALAHITIFLLNTLPSSSFISLDFHPFLSSSSTLTSSSNFAAFITLLIV